MPMLPLILSLGSMVTTGVAWFLAGRIGKRISPLFSTFFFQLIGIPFFIVLFPLNTTPLYSVNTVGIAGVGAFETFVMLVLFRALKEGNISIVLPIVDLYALVTFGLGIFFLHESLTVVKFFGALCIGLGVVLLSINLRKTKMQKLFSAQQGAVLAIIAALGTGVYFYWITLLVRTSGWFYTALGIRLSITLTAFFILIVTGQLWKKQDVRIPWKWIATGAVLDVIAFSLYNAAVGLYETSYVTVITSSSSLISVLLGVWFLKERLVRYQIIGIVLIIGGLMLLQFR